MPTTAKNFKALLSQAGSGFRRARKQTEELIVACQAENLDTTPLDDIPAEAERLRQRVQAYTARITQIYVLHDDDEREAAP